MIAEAAFWMSGSWGGGFSARTVTAASIAAGNVPLRAGPGSYFKVLVVSANGANPVLIYDNAVTAAGTVLGVVPASAAAGNVYQFPVGYNFGVTIAQTAAAGALTISFN